MNVSQALGSSSDQQNHRSPAAIAPGRESSEEFIPKTLKVAKQKGKGPKHVKNISQSEQSEPTVDVNFPPHPPSTDRITRKHEEFDVQPAVEEIERRSKNVPYNSEKRRFSSKTGRDGFKVFYYNFTHPDTSDQWTVMWDYEIGLVRMTPFFKALGHGKTVPKKAITTNKGLSELCYSITGGSISAQGYWIPFEAAKALAATFCWTIRYALTPLFGNDFPATCVPKEHADFEDFKINDDVVHRCAYVAESSWQSPKGQIVKKWVAISSPEITSPEQSDTQGSPSKYLRRSFRTINRKSYGQFDSLETSESEIAASPYCPSVSSSKRMISDIEEDGGDDDDDDHDEGSVQRKKVKRGQIFKTWKLSNFTDEEKDAAKALVLMSQSTEHVEY